MTEPRQPETGKGAKSGVVPGKGAPPVKDKREGGARPVEEEDVFGGAERAQKGEPVTSKNTKP